MYQSGLELGDAQASGISLDTSARASLGQVPAEVIQAELTRPGGDVQRTAEVLAAEGTRLLYAGLPEEAAAVFQKAQDLVERAGVKNAWVAPLLPWLATALRCSAEALADATPGRRQALLRRAWVIARRAVRLARSFPNEQPHALREAGLLCALLGRSRRAQRYFKDSLTAARRQRPRFEQAQTLLARGQVGLELNWPGAAEDVGSAISYRVSAFGQTQGPNPFALLLRCHPWESRGPRGGGPTTTDDKRPVTLSLADRFDTVLDAGRRIASALSRESIYVAVREAALALLRAERCLVLKVEGSAGEEDITAASGELDTDFSRTMVRRTLVSGRGLSFIGGVPESTSESVLLAGVRSALCAPFFVRGRAVGCFYVTHRQVAGLFGEEEERLADFIATLAGAALENAEGFAELRRLNAALEKRIDEAKRAEKRIQEQAALLDKAQDAISVHDLGDDGGRVLFWNHSAERLYGWAAVEALGRPTGELLYRGSAAQLEEASRAVLEKDEWAGELRQVTRAGKEIVVESRWSLVRDDAGQPRARLVVSTDVTEKKELEAQFLRAQRMESIGTLAGGIAHDINNVLTPILMGVGLLRLGLAPGEQEAVLGDLEASAQRSADMVKQILMFARGVEGQRVLLRLKHVLVELERMARRTFPKSLDVTLDLPEDLWSVQGDATQLYQMLMNLCVNARDAMPEGGILTIGTANVELDATDTRLQFGARPGAYVRLTVADTGTGIPPEVLEKIFDPFFTTKEFGKGTGLGLATVLGIARGHGGFVHVTTEIGRGTQFSVYLPAADRPQPRQAEAELAGPRRGQQELILVVDDELFIREITRKNLEAHGYRVLTAARAARPWPSMAGTGERCAPCSPT